jgi:broad specificity phosphatase PhoE
VRPARIILVRHGRSTHPVAGWFDTDGLHRWFAAYDAAGIVADDEPPEELRTLASSADLVVASDLRRAIESAHRIAPGVSIQTSALLREVPLRIARFRFPLPILGWALAVGTGAALRRLRRAPMPADIVAQATDAAEWLGALAERHGTVVAVTHSMIRGQVASALIAAHWRRDPGGGRHAHWSAWSFTRVATL